MALYYLETSALVKLYVREHGTGKLLQIADRLAENRLTVLALAQAEIRSAIRRRERAGDIDPSLATLLIERFERHLQSRFQRQGVNDLVLDAASPLIDRHSLRAYDALQLAGCLALRRISSADLPVFVCADRRLIEAAIAEGLATLNPETDAN